MTVRSVVQVHKMNAAALNHWSWRVFAAKALATEKQCADANAECALS